LDPPKVAREQFVGANDEFQFPPLPPLVGKGSSENNTGVHGRRNLGLVRALILTPTGNLQTSRTLSVLLCKRGHPNCADYEHALRVVSTRPFQGAMVSIQRVPLPSSIQVHGIVAGISQDQLRVYLAGKGRLTVFACSRTKSLPSSSSKRASVSFLQACHFSVFGNGRFVHTRSILAIT